MSRKTKIITIITLTVIVLAVGGLLVRYFLSQKKERISPEETLLQAVPDLPKNKWPRVITTRDDGPGYKVAINQFDGYEVTVSSSWQVEGIASTSGGLKVFYNPSGTPSYGELTQGVMLNVVTFENPDDLPLTNWLNTSKEAKNLFRHGSPQEVKTSQGTVYRVTYQLFEDRIAQDSRIIEVPIDKSWVVNYVFRGSRKIYVVSCWALGDQFKELVEACEKQIPTFTVLNR